MISSCQGSITFGLWNSSQSQSSAYMLFPSPGQIEACVQGSTCNESPRKIDFFSSGGVLVNLVSTVSTTAGGGVPLGSALHPPVSIGTARGGVPPGSPSSFCWCNRWWSASLSLN